MSNRKPVSGDHVTIIQFIKDNLGMPFKQMAEILEGKGVKRKPETLRRAYKKHIKEADKNEKPQKDKPDKPQLTPEQQFQLDVEELKTRRAEKEGNKAHKVALAEVVRLREQLEKLAQVEGVKHTHAIPAKSHKDKEIVAVVVFSDWHVEENVKPETVDYSNEYTMAIAKQRAQAVFRNALTLIKKEQGRSKINKLVLALLGDFTSNDIHPELAETCEVQPMDAILFAQELLADGIQYLLDNSNLELVIPCACGNHSRTTEKVQVSTEQGHSLEWMMYKNLAMYFKINKRVTFVLSRSYFTWVDILGYKVRFHHGHAIKYGGGIGGFTIPIIKAISRYDQQQAAYLDVIGHLHTKFDGGKFIVNGSLIGNTPYGTRLGFTGKPEQTFFLIQEGYGKTVVAPIFVE